MTLFSFFFVFAFALKTKQQQQQQQAVPNPFYSFTLVVTTPTNDIICPPVLLAISAICQIPVEQLHVTRLEGSSLDPSFASISIACMDPNCATSIKPLIAAVANGGDNFPYIIATFTEDQSGSVSMLFQRAGSHSLICTQTYKTNTHTRTHKHTDNAQRSIRSWVNACMDVMDNYRFHLCWMLPNCLAHCLLLWFIHCFSEKIPR